MIDTKVFAENAARHHLIHAHYYGLDENIESLVSDYFRLAKEYSWDIPVDIKEAWEDVSGSPGGAVWVLGYECLMLDATLVLFCPRVLAERSLYGIKGVAVRGVESRSTLTSIKSGLCAARVMKRHLVKKGVLKDEVTELTLRYQVDLLAPDMPGLLASMNKAVESLSGDLEVLGVSVSDASIGRRVIKV